MFEFSPDRIHLMPAHFGLWGEGQPRPSQAHDATTLSIDYETDGEMLARYIPGPFELSRPILNVSYTLFRRVDWLGGGGYNLVQVAAPVVYAAGGERLQGMYVLVIWENRTAPILTGREQTGMPKIFAEIEDYHQIGDQLWANVSYEGSSFLRIRFRQGGPLSPQDLAALNRDRGSMNTFGWRYIPNIGRPGAALSHATLFPMESATSAAWLGTGAVQWEEPVTGQYPSQFGAVRALGQMPVRTYGDCLMARCAVTLRNDLARQLP